MKHLFGDEPQYSPNVIVNSTFSGAKHELSNVRMSTSSDLLTITARVRNDNGPAVQALCVRLLEDKFCTYARYNRVTQNY